MTYHVTELDIRAGEPNDGCLCPVARAIKRRHPSAGVIVRISTAQIGSTTYRLPKRVQDWIDAYDADKPVTPIRFELLATTR